MDRPVENYAKLIEELVVEFADRWRPHDGTKLEAVTDSKHGHYQVVRTGWKDGRFLHACLVHFVVRDGRIELWKNETDVEWDRELVERGVLPVDIVLKFREQHSAREIPASA